MKDDYFKQDLPNDFQYSCEVDLGRSSMFHCGGRADVLFRPSNVEELASFCKNFPHKERLYVVDACSNILVRDGGVRGVVIKLGSNFKYVKKLNDEKIEVGAATPDSAVSKFCADNGLAGLEFFSGIPGTIGGNIRTNAGCYGSDISHVLVSFTAIDINDGSTNEFENLESFFSYRRNSLSRNFIFTNAVLQVQVSSKEVVSKRVESIQERRKDTQPVRERTGGSTFVNPPEQAAWQLIEACGLRGAQVGAAQMSLKHANFLVNKDDDATATELEALGELVRAAVLHKYGINLEWEIERIGDY